MLKQLQTFSLKGWKIVLFTIFISLAAGCNLINHTSSTRLVSSRQPLDESLDKQTSQNIRTNLKQKLGSLANRVKIKTNNGIVLLSGTINNEFNREIAVEIIKKTNGVRSVIDQIIINPVVRSEKQILADVNTALQTAQIFSQDPIEVTVKNNTVTLSGTVNLWEKSDIARKIVTQIPGVNQVNNHILVDHHISPTDTQLEQIIRQNLLWNNRIRASEIEVKVENGRVTLTGLVSSSKENYIAVNDAYITGIKEVNGARLIVDPRLSQQKHLDNTAKYRSDLEIKNNIQDTFKADSTLQQIPVQVRIKNGIVTLKGKVESLTIKQAALRNAKNTVGVVRVYDEIEVKNIST